MNVELIMLQEKLVQYKTNHILHLILSIISAGFWIPVWFIIALNNAIERKRTFTRMRKIKGFH